MMQQKLSGNREDMSFVGEGIRLAAYTNDSTRTKAVLANIPKLDLRGQSRLAK